MEKGKIISGVYKITNKIKGKFYIGSSKNIYRRWIEHKTTLNNKNHRNSYLQNAWNKYGKDNFEFSILEECTKEEIFKREQIWINNTKCCLRDIGYNISPTVNNSIMSESTKKKMSKNNIGEKNNLAVFTEGDVLQIINLFKYKTVTEISKIYNAHRSTIESIKKGKSWSYLTGIEYKPKNKNILNKNDVLKI